MNAYARAQASAEAGEQYRRAIEEDFDRAIGLNPESAKAHMHRGNAAGELSTHLAGAGKPEEARPYFARADESLTKAIELDGGDAEARWRRGYFRLEAGRADLRDGRRARRAGDALSDFESALKLNGALELMLRPFIEQAHRAIAEESEY